MQQEARRRPTIMDVARLAGVSHQTVSRYFRETGGMKPATRSAIDVAVAELNYRPSELARSMRTRRSNRIAVVIPGPTDFLPYALIRAAASEAHLLGYQLEIVGIEGGAEARTARVRELADSGQVDGVLSLAPLDQSVALPTWIGSAPVVVAAAYDDAMRGIGEIASGDPAREIVEHLAGLGHRRFLHIAGPQEFSSARNRRAVYEESIARLGLESYGVIDGDWTGESGRRAIAELPEDSGVTAVFAANDIMALGVIRAANDRGWSVPRDLSVFGWNDEEYGWFSTPSLSTVTNDNDAQGRRAIRRLRAAILQVTFTPTDQPPVNRLIVRESTGPAPQPR